MTYVKADVPEDVHRSIRMEAAKYGMSIEQITKEALIEHYNE